MLDGCLLGVVFNSILIEKHFGQTRLTSNLGLAILSDPVDASAQDDLLIYDADDEGAVAAVRNASARLLPVSGRRQPPGGAGVSDGGIDLGELVVPLIGVPIADPAYLADLVSAGVAALTHGAKPESVERIITTFRPGPHRRTLVGRWGDVDWVDDSKATNPHAARALPCSFGSCDRRRSLSANSPGGSPRGERR